MSRRVTLPPSLPPSFAPREPAVPQAASQAPPSSGTGGRPRYRHYWKDPVAVPARPDLAAMQVWSLTAADACTVTVSGEIDCLTAPGLQEVLLDVLDRRQPPGGVVVDLSRVTFLGAAGLTVLARGHHLAENTGGMLRIRCGTARAVIRPLQATGLWVTLHVIERESARDGW